MFCITPVTRRSLFSLMRRVRPTTPVVLRGERLVPLGRNGELSGVVLRHPSGGIVVATIDHEVLDAAGLSQLKRVEGLQLPREGDVILF